MQTPSWLAIAVFIGLNLAAASSGGLFKPGAWYKRLRKPSWTPPNWAFPVVWGLLFSVNAWAGWLVWETAGRSALPALAVYTVSLMLNAAWSWLFFGQRRMAWALVDVVLLWLSLACVILLFWQIRPFAALLLLPYLGWVAIAATLNLTVWRMNPATAPAAELPQP